VHDGAGPGERLDGLAQLGQVDAQEGRKLFLRREEIDGEDVVIALEQAANHGPAGLPARTGDDHLHLPPDNRSGARPGLPLGAAQRQFSFDAVRPNV
jgi:hypothetical protein